MFKKLDGDNTGYITLEDLKKGMRGILDKFQYQNCDWASYYKAMDVNRTGKINFSEFTTAALSRAMMLSQKNLNTVFDVFDVDQDGLVSVEDLRAVFHENLDVGNMMESGLESMSM